MKKILLTDCCELVMGQSPVSSSYNTEKRGLPFYQGNADFGKINPITRCWCDKPIKIAYKDDILISVRAPIGAINIASEECCIGRGLAAVRALKGKCLYEFLYYALQSNTEELKSQGTGSTFKAISKQILANSELPDITLEEQHRIVNRLLKVDTLIENANEQLRLFDQLVKSRFIEMFGNPAINPNSYPVKSMDEIANYWNGLTYKPENVSNEGTIVLRSSNIQNGKLDFKDIVRVNCQIGEKKYVRNNDILMCSRNGSSKLVGKVALIESLTEPMCFGAFMMVIRSNYYPYLLTYFNTDAFRRQLSVGATTTINQITVNMLNKITVPVPPIEQVKEYSFFVNQVNKSKFTHCYELLLLIIKKIWYNNYV